MLKKYILNILYYTIELIEKYQYSNLKLDENDVSKKILETHDLEGIYLHSDSGYLQASNIHVTQPYTIWKVILENGMMLECADNHIVFTDTLAQKFVRDLAIGEQLFTCTGASAIVSVEKLKHKVSMYDITIDHPTHRYYTNGILSHNTVSAAIVILYYVTFNTDKNCLITANKLDTVKEIINKVKSIYYLLPFWLKPSVTNWNQTTISFGSTGCVIKSAAATPNAGIGNTIDFLYVDEMAHLPRNILDEFYRALYPTVSAVNNSKIVLTSTPNGYNLFYKLLNGAERPIGDKAKNNYRSLRVYWWQVPGRYVTYLRLDSYLCKQNHISEEEVFEHVKSLGFNCSLKYSSQEQRYEIQIPNKTEDLPDFMRQTMVGKEGDDMVSDYFRGLPYEVKDVNGHVKRYKLVEFCDVSSWKEDAIKDIGGIEKFNQEYDLQFANGNKQIFDSQTLNRFANGKKPFIHHDIPLLNQKTFVKYDDLKWVDDPAIFNIADIQNYHLVLGVDLSEGLGQDFSVINIFRVMPKPEEEWGVNLESINDLFKLEQVGLYRCNTVSIPELAELLYLLCYEVMNENKIGVVLEVNMFGGELLGNMRNLWNGRNNYSTHIFYRYKHRIDAVNTEIGIKLRSNKNIFVKQYQKRLRAGDIIVHEEGVILEITTFIKEETAAGNIQFRADSGHDDCVPADTLITTMDGIKKIVDVKVGDYVMTHLGRWRKVLKTGSRHADKIYKISSVGKLDLCLTSNHRMYLYERSANHIIRKGGEYFINDAKWVNVDEGIIKNKHYTSYIADSTIQDVERIDFMDYCDPAKYTEQGGKLYSILYGDKDRLNPKQNPIDRYLNVDEDFCFLMGYYLAEGSNNGSHQLSFASHASESNIRSKVIAIGDKLGISGNVYPNIDDNGFRVVLNSKPLVNFFKTFGKGDKKKLPVFLRQLPLEKCLSILEGYLLGDGTFNQVGASVSSISEDIIFTFYDILVRCGYKPSLCKCTQPQASFVGKSHIYKLILNEAEKQSLLDRFDSVLIGDKNVTRTTISENPKRHSRLKYKDEYLLGVVNKIEELPFNDLVYNLEVEDDNSYIANGNIVHNCVMTIVELSTVFENTKFGETITELIKELPDSERLKIEKRLGDAPNMIGADYTALFQAQKKTQSSGASPWGGGGSGWGALGGSGSNWGSLGGGSGNWGSLGGNKSGGLW
jgi:hypothetical protein